MLLKTFSLIGTSCIIVCYIFHFHIRTSRQADIIPLRRFIEDVVKQDLRSFSSDECFEVCKILLFLNRNFRQLALLARPMFLAINETIGKQELCLFPSRLTDQISGQLFLIIASQPYSL